MAYTGSTAPSWQGNNEENHFQTPQTFYGNPTGTTSASGPGGASAMGTSSMQNWEKFEEAAGVHSQAENQAPTAMQSSTPMQPPPYVEKGNINEANTAQPPYPEKPPTYNFIQNQPNYGRPIEPVQPPRRTDLNIIVVRETPIICATAPPTRSFTGDVVLSCFVTWCFCLIFGLIAYALAVTAQNEEQSGNRDSATTAARWSRALSVAGIISGIIVVVVICSVYNPSGSI